MKVLAIVVALSVAAHVQRVGGQSAELLRCAARIDVPCLKIETPQRVTGLSGVATFYGQPMRVIGALPHDSATAVYLLVPNGAIDRLGRLPVTGVIHGAPEESDIQWRWKPPLIAEPGFAGVADSLALPAGVRRALGAGSSDLVVRLTVAATLLIFVLAIVLSLPRLTWGDPAPVARARRTAAPTATADMGGVERLPRSPDDITLQTARRTALDR
jgi:hypothetical protein